MTTNFNTPKTSNDYKTLLKNLYTWATELSSTLTYAINNLDDDNLVTTYLTEDDLTENTENLYKQVRSLLTSYVKITELSEELSSINSSIETIEEYISSIQDSISDLDTRVSALEGE